MSDNRSGSGKSLPQRKTRGATIRNCHFSFKCPKRWDDLVDDKMESNSRLCPSCDKRVYICKTMQEVEGRALAGECVAIYTGACSQMNRDKPNHVSLHTLGVPARSRDMPPEDFE
jgi:hypothetical protein